MQTLKQITSLLLCMVLLVGLSACAKKEIQISTTGNKGYTDKPILSFRALDANGEWVDAEIDDNDRNITFHFCAQTSLQEITCRLVVDPEWGKLVSPETEEFILNLNASQVITVNDGVDDIRYRVTGELSEYLSEVKLSAGGGRGYRNCQPDPDYAVDDGTLPRNPQPQCSRTRKN